MSADVLVVIGTGGMGTGCASAVRAGRRILLADFNEALLQDAVDAALAEGYDVESCGVDVSSRNSVAALAATARELGRVTAVVHTAGLSPAQAPAEAIWKVDLYGVALVLEEFEKVIANGGAGVVISSMSAYMAGGTFPRDALAELAAKPADDLLGLPFVDRDRQSRIRLLGCEACQPGAGPGRERPLGRPGRPGQQHQSRGDFDADGPAGTGGRVGSADAGNDRGLGNRAGRNSRGHCQCRGVPAQLATRPLLPAWICWSTAA